MAFIRATWISTESSVTLNTDQIVAVADHDGKAVVYTNIPSRDGYLQFWLKESYDAITTKIALALDK